MQTHEVCSREEWLEARKALLIKEKEFTRQRDQLSADRRSLPWVLVDQDYCFDGPNGQESLGDLFAGKRQLVVYHFMFGPDWEEGCKSCSFWADNFNGIDTHLAHRDVTLLAISQAPLAKLDAYKERMGWDFKWVSSYGNNFNYDYNVSFTPEMVANNQAYYNYQKSTFSGDEAAGISVFFRNEQGQIFHTYSTYSRGLDMLNGAYHYLDLLPKGRDEAGLPYTMAWLYRHDEYKD